MSSHTARQASRTAGVRSTQPKTQKGSKQEPEPKLFKVPSIREMDREELEAILDGIRLRRMSAATEWVRGKNAKYGREISKLEDRIRRQYDMLEKELANLDKAIEKCEKRVVEIETLKQSQGLISDQLVTIGADDAEDEDE